MGLEGMTLSYMTQTQTNKTVMFFCRSQGVYVCMYLQMCVKRKTRKIPIMWKKWAMRVDKKMGKECGPKDTWHMEEEKKLSEGMLQVVTER